MDLISVITMRTARYDTYVRMWKMVSKTKDSRLEHFIEVSSVSKIGRHRSTVQFLYALKSTLLNMNRQIKNGVYKYNGWPIYNYNGNYICLSIKRDRQNVSIDYDIVFRGGAKYSIDKVIYGLSQQDELITSIAKGSGFID